MYNCSNAWPSLRGEKAQALARGKCRPAPYCLFTGPWADARASRFHGDRRRGHVCIYFTNGGFRTGDSVPGRLQSSSSHGEISNSLEGDIGEMILPGANKVSSMGTNISRGVGSAMALKRVWVNLCILYQDPQSKWHYSGYRYMSTSQGQAPQIFRNHPSWSYLPFTGMTLVAASAN